MFPQIVNTIHSLKCDDKDYRARGLITLVTHHYSTHQEHWESLLPSLYRVWGLNTDVLEKHY